MEKLKLVLITPESDYPDIDIVVVIEVDNKTIDIKFMASSNGSSVDNLIDDKKAFFAEWEANLIEQIKRYQYPEGIYEEELLLLFDDLGWELFYKKKTTKFP